MPEHPAFREALQAARSEQYIAPRLVVGAGVDGMSDGMGERL